MPGGIDLAAGGCGFCLLNNAAVAAADALARSPDARVAIVDFDVHYGNGTVTWAFNESSERLLYASTHIREVYENSDLDFFPGGGSAWASTGTPTAELPPGEEPMSKRTRTTICDVPVEPNWVARGARARFVAAVETIAERLATFRPSLLILSAGFDACAGDAGQLNPWTRDDPRTTSARLPFFCPGSLLMSLS